MGKQGRDRGVCCAFMGLCLLTRWCYFQSLLKLVPPAGFIGDPNMCAHSSISFGVSTQEPGWFPGWLSAVEAAETIQSRRLGSPNPAPAARSMQELREAISPNNLTRPPNCFLLLTKNHTSSSDAPQGNLCLL